MATNRIEVLPSPLAAVLALALAMGGCENMSERQQGTAKGAGIGAVAGAVIGGVTGNSAGKGAVVGGALGAVAGNLWSKRMEDKRRQLAQSTAGSGVAVDRTADNRLKLNVPSDVSFDTGSADIKPSMRATLDQVGRSIESGMHVTVVGHTDGTGPTAVNDTLSLQRAQAVRSYFAARGIEASRIAAEGRGSHEPVADNGTEAGRAQNRRVEIFLSDTQA